MHPQKGRHTVKVLPTLREKEKDNTKAVIVIVLVFVAVLSGVGVAYEIGIATAHHVNGSCPPPDIINSQGCFSEEVQNGANGGKTTVLVPAGSILP